MQPARPMPSMVMISVPRPAHRRDAGADRLAIVMHGAGAAQRHPASEFVPVSPRSSRKYHSSGIGVAIERTLDTINFQADHFLASRDIINATTGGDVPSSGDVRNTAAYPQIDGISISNCIELTWYAKLRRSEEAVPNVRAAPAENPADAARLHEASNCFARAIRPSDPSRTAGQSAGGSVPVLLLPDSLHTGLQLLERRVDVGDGVFLMTLEISRRICLKRLSRMPELFHCLMHGWKCPPRSCTITGGAWANETAGSASAAPTIKVPTKV